MNSAQAAEERAKVAPQAMVLLKANCFGCHNEEKKKGDLILTSRSAALKGNGEGPVLLPGKADQSKLIKALAADADPHMPPKKQLTEKQIAVLRSWIDAGAAWDDKALAAFGQSTPLEKIGALPFGYEPVLAVALSPDGQHLAVARGSTVSIYETAATNEVPKVELKEHRDVVQSLAWSPDGKRLASGSYREVIVWDAAGKREQRLTKGLLDRVTALKFSPDGALLAAADGIPTKAGVVRLFETSSWKLNSSWDAHSDSILSLDISHDGNLLATGSADKLAKIWSLSNQLEVAKLEGIGGHVLGLQFSPDDLTLATASADKVLNLWDVKTKHQTTTLAKHPAPLTALAWATNGKSLVTVSEDAQPRIYTDFKSHTGKEQSEGAQTRALPSAGEVLHSVAISNDGKTIYAGAQDGLVYVWNDGKLKGTLTPNVSSAGFSLSDSSSTVGARTNRLKPALQTGPRQTLSFLNDVLPVIGKAGCNAGSCHAKAEGQNGFKLSVFAYDPKSDYRQIVKADRGRRVFPAFPEESLILKKPTLALEHEGGQRFERGSAAYKTIVEWIKQGMPYSISNEATLVELKVTPVERSYRKLARQSLRVEARYSNGSKRDVTDLADFSSTDKEIAKVDDTGKVTVGQISGEGVIVARYMGLVAISRITVPADKALPDSLYRALPVNNDIDRLVYGRLKKLGLAPSDTCTDSEFLRRASLDSIGRLPSVEQTRAFLSDTNSDRREKLIDSLLDDPNYAHHWAIKWGDLIRPNPSRVGVKPVFLLDLWLREAFAENKPYDQFVRELLTAEGSTHKYGPVAVFRDKREPVDASSFVSQIFFGVRMECAKCHHHPNEKWSQADYYQLAACFGAMKHKGQGISAPISGEPEYWWFAPGGEVKHPVTGEVMKPKPPDAPPLDLPTEKDPRVALVDWMCRPDNPFFARAIVNRIWANFMGRGIVDPVDDFRASNPPTNEPLLDWLARDFVMHKYDLKHLMRTIMRSRVYQLSSLPNKYNVADTKNFSRSYRRRLSAEVLLDAVYDVTGATDSFDGLPPGSRAIETWNHKLNSEFMDAFGRPNSSAECPCERDSKPSVVQVLHLMNSNKLQSKIGTTEGHAKKLAESKLSEREIIEELYLCAFCRQPTDSEVHIAGKAFTENGATRKTAIEDLLWALINSPEFVFNH